MTWAGLIPNAGMYGSGVDGDVTVSAGVTTLSRNMHYNNLTVNGTGRIDPNGFEILVKDILTFGDSCEISSIGMDGSGFEGGLPTFPGTITGQGSGGNGAIDTFTGNPGTAGTYNISMIGAGGAGGEGDAGPPEGGFAAYSAQTAAQGGNSSRIHQHFLMETRVYNVAANYIDLSGYGGGGGTGDGVAEIGGGGGGTGGAIIVKARRIIGTGFIESIGGNGADGGLAGGGTGGGGAGPGGSILVFCDSIDSSVTVQGVSGTPGLGQNGGTDGGTATNAPVLVMRASD